MTGRNVGDAEPAERGRALQAYIDAAKGGRSGFWRVLGLLALLFVCLQLITIAFGVGAALLGWLPETTLERDRFILVAALIGVGSVPMVLAALLPLLQGRAFASLLGPTGRLDQGHLAIGALTALAMVTIGALAGWALGFHELSWVEDYEPPWALILLAALLIPLQSAGEELVFRGYLLQELGRRVDCLSPFGILLWAAAPSALFGALHLGGGATPLEEGLYVVATLCFGLFAAGLVWLSGGLSAAIGFHVANNLISILLFEPPVGVAGLGPIAVTFVPERLYASVLAEIVLLAIVWVLLLRTLRPRTDPAAASRAGAAP